MFLATLPRKGLAGVSPIAVTRARKLIYNAFEIVESVRLPDVFALNDVRLPDVYPKTPYACQAFIFFLKDFVGFVIK